MSTRFVVAKALLIAAWTCCTETFWTAQAQETDKQTNLDPSTETVMIDKPTPAAVMHHSLDGLNLPPEGVDVHVKCTLHPASGVISKCTAPPGETVPDTGTKKTPLLAAELRLETIRVRPDPNVSNPDAYATFEVILHLSPDDRLDLGPSSNVRRADEISWRRAPPSPDVLPYYYPLEELTQPVKLTYTCQIQEDLSTVCTEFSFVPAGEAVERENPFWFAQSQESMPTLKDGSPAPGTWVAIGYMLNPGPSSPSLRIPVAKAAPPRN